MLFDKIQPDFTTELETQEEIRLSRIKNTTERGGTLFPIEILQRDVRAHPKKKIIFNR